MLTEMVQYGHKAEEKVKAMKSNIKENVPGTNSEGRETGTQINNLDQKEDNQNRMKKQEFKEMKRGLGNSRTSLNVPTSEL